MRGHQLELAATTCLKNGVQRVFEQSLREASHLDETERLETLTRVRRTAEIRERELLTMMRTGKVDDARSLLFTISELHAQARAFESVAAAVPA